MQKSSFSPTRVVAGLLGFFGALAACSSDVGGQISFQTFNVPSPNGPEPTEAQGVSADLVVGSYNIFGFIYNRQTGYQTFQVPSAYATYPEGVSGNVVVGRYDDQYQDSTGAYRTVPHGFIYDGSSISTLDVPGALSTEALGISGNTVVGWYHESSGTDHGFMYDRNTNAFTTLDDPLGVTQPNTVANGTDGSRVVGYYSDANRHMHGFVYDIAAKTYTSLDDPLAGIAGTSAQGIFGNLVVGWYYGNINNPNTGYDFHGFIFDLATDSYTTVEPPGGSGRTVINGIYGNTIVGTYDTGSQPFRGFLGFLPEPSVIQLLILCGAAAATWRRRRPTLTSHRR